MLLQLGFEVFTTMRVCGKGFVTNVGNLLHSRVLHLWSTFNTLWICIAVVSSILLNAVSSTFAGLSATGGFYKHFACGWPVSVQ